MSELTIPKFVKWAGGKKQLIDQFRLFLPEKIERYFEPFVGSGAIAFYVIKNFKPKEVFLSDINEELINAYNIIKIDVENLIKELKILRENHNKENYYKIRSIDPKCLTALKKAARFIYLNKTCFNGLYRVNSKGEFNVPMGDYKKPAIYSEEDLREISKLLENVKIEVKQFYEITEKIKKNDFIYFDPPYYPLNKTSSFTTYTKDNFLENEQIKLKETFMELNKKGAKIMLSNSDTNFIKDLYKDYNINLVQANRMINCDATKRGKINEVVVTN